MKTLIRNVKLFDGTALAPRPMDVLFDESGILAVKEAGAARRQPTQSWTAPARP